MIMEIVFFIIAFLIGTWWYSVIILPIIYSIPKSVFLIFQKELRKTIVLNQLLTPIIWTVISTVIAFLIIMFIPKFAQFLYSSYGFYFGQLFGIGFMLVRSFTRAGRKDLDEDYWKIASKYKH